MTRFLKKHVSGSHLKFYGYCCLLLLFVAAVVGGMLLSLKKDDQRRFLPFMVSGKVEPVQSQPTLSGSYLASQFAVANRDYGVAAEYAQKAIAFDADNQALNSHGLQLALAAGNVEQAEKLAKTLIDQDFKEPLALLVHLGKLVREARYAEASDLMQNAPKRGMYQLIQPVLMRWLDVGQMLAGEKEKQAVISFKGVDLNGFLGPFMQYQRGLMNDMLGFEEEARAAYAAASDNPSLTPYRVVQAIANFHLRHGDAEAAKKPYEDYRLHHPDSDFASPQWEENEEAPAPLVANPAQGLAEIYFTAASLLFGERASQETLMYLRLSLALRPDFPAAQMMLAGLFEQQGKHQKAVAVYQGIDPTSLFFRQGRMRVALNYRAAGQTDAAIELLKNMIKESPTNEEAIKLLGDIYRFEEKYGKAAEVFSKALSSLPEQEWGWEFYYRYGISLERLKRWDVAEKAFQKALQLSPDEPDVLNYLGYSLLERKENIDEAMGLIRKAYEQEPNAAHIIDSMGWAYYLTGEYEKAVTLLEEAVELAPQDPTINDHLGDAYWRVGRRQEARFQWDRALAFEPEKPEPIRVKLQDGLPKPDTKG